MPKSYKGITHLMCQFRPPTFNSSTAAFHCQSIVADLYLCAGDGADLHGTGSGGCRRRVTVPGGATAPIRAHWPRYRLYLAGDVNVWLVYPATPLFAANAPHADEQSPTGRLTWRCVCYGGDCRTDLFTMHHRTA